MIEDEMPKPGDYLRIPSLMARVNPMPYYDQRFEVASSAGHKGYGDTLGEAIEDCLETMAWGRS